LEHLDQVNAEGRANRLADLARRQRVHRALEFGHRVAGIDPAEIAAAPRTAVGRILARHLAEIGGAALHLLADLAQAAEGLFFADHFVRADQDVPGARLGDRLALQRRAGTL